MKLLRHLWMLVVLPWTIASAQPAGYPGVYNVNWTSQSADAWGSMPIGNGDIGTNLWVTPDGTLHLLLRHL